jgi:DNA mismatch endonuclease (patch repair protein)
MPPKPDSLMPAPLPPRRAREPLTRSQMMSRIRARNTNPEIRVRSAVHRLGLRFRKHGKDLPGNPDLVNRRKRWIIFVHGCFWHSHAGCPVASQPKSNTCYWKPKLEGNLARDRRHYHELQALGYSVFVVWECETRNPELLNSVLLRLRDQILRRGQNGQPPC